MQSSQSNKSSTSRFFTGVLILVIIVAVLAVLLYMSGIPFFSGWTPCYPPPWVSVDGVARAEVYTFYDANQNGVPEEGERSLPNIEVRMGEAAKTTGADGKAILFIFKEGCACNCSKNETVSITVPLTWQATTPTEIRLTGNEPQLNFGLIKP